MFRPSALRTLRTQTRAFTTTRPNLLARMQLIGRLAQSPEATVTANGHELIRYAVGTSSGPQDNRQTSWFRVAAFDVEGPRKELLLNLPKGTLVYVDADSRLSTYETEGGQKNTRLDLIQRNIDVLSRPRTNSEGLESEPAAEAATA